MKKILLFPLYFIGLIVYNIAMIISFFYKLLFNIFEKKSKKTIKDLVAIDYYSEEWPDLVSFCIYYDKNIIPANAKISTNSIKISKKQFNELSNIINNKKIIEHVKYYLYFPLISFFEFKSFFFIDGGPTRQMLKFYFKDGTEKRLEGYSKELKDLRFKMEDIIPNELFNQ